MISFMAEQKQVDVFPSADPGRPIVYLHTYGQEGRQVYQYLRQTDCPDFTLVAVSGLAWDHDMVPWDSPPLSEKSAPFTGGAEEHLGLLLNEIMPEAEKSLPGRPAWRGIAGYSLAGLFAVYALYRTGVFSRVASVSGSLWFPGIKEYIFSHQPVRKPDCVYFSLGDKEHRTRNPFMKCVQQNTGEIAAFYQKQGIDTLFQLNPGNHFKDSVQRTAAGIRWIIQQ